MASRVHFEGAGATLPSDNITGNGTINKVAKFTGASTLGDSLITDNGIEVDVDAKLFSDRLFTNVANVSANITSFSETSSTVVTSYSINAVDAYFGTIELLDFTNGLPIFIVGDQLTIFTNGTLAPVVIQLSSVGTSNAGRLSANYTLVSGVETDFNYANTFEATITVTNTLLNVDTDLTSSVSVGNSIILGGLSYIVSAITSTVITIALANSAIANLANIDTLGIESDFNVLSYKSTLDDGTNVQQTTLLGYNLVNDRTFLRGSIDFLGTSPTIANQFIGVNSGLNNTTGYYNTSNGFDSMKSNTIGYDNSSFGFNSLKNNISAYNNCAFGSNALRDVTTGYGNVAVGSGALQQTNGYENVAVGSGALGQTNTGYENVGIGHNALSQNNNGFENIAIGNNSLGSNSNGYENIALGNRSLGENNNGFENIAIGYNAGLSLRDANNNTIIGNNAVSGGSNQNSNKHSVFGAATVVANNTDGSVVLGYGAESTLSNQFVVGSTTESAGAVAAEVNSSANVWNVIINGVARKILLA